MLKLEQIHKTFYQGTADERVILSNFNLAIREGEFVTLVGGNGAGKSTLFNLICGNLLPDQGSILLDGENMTYWPEHRRAAIVGRIFQDPSNGTAPNLTLEENLAVAYLRSTKRSLMGRYTKKDALVLREKLASLNLGLEDRMQTKIGLLSGGQRQAVTLVMATLVKPKLLLLDEHTAALDPLSTTKVLEITKKIVEENNITTMMITHHIGSALEMGTRTLMLDQGEIAIDISGPTRKQMTPEGLLEQFAKVKQKRFDYDRALL